MSLGKLIKKEIKSHKRTQKDVAFEIGISETALSQIITETYFPSKLTIDKLCNVLKVKLIFSFEPESD
jgi:transcriptional regulator with XRE-family HTH domain